MWPQDQGLLIPHEDVLRLQLVNEALGMNGLGLPAGKGARRDKSCPFGVVPLTGTWNIHWEGQKPRCASPLLSSPPLPAAFSW